MDVDGGVDVVHTLGKAHAGAQLQVCLQQKLSRFFCIVIHHLRPNPSSSSPLSLPISAPPSLFPYLPPPLTLSSQSSPHSILSSLLLPLPLPLPPNFQIPYVSVFLGRPLHFAGEGGPQILYFGLKPSISVAHAQFQDPRITSSENRE